MLRVRRLVHTLPYIVHAPSTHIFRYAGFDPIPRHQRSITRRHVCRTQQAGLISLELFLLRYTIDIHMERLSWMSGPSGSFGRLDIGRISVERLTVTTGCWVMLRPDHFQHIMHEHSWEIPFLLRGTSRTVQQWRPQRLLAFCMANSRFRSRSALNRLQEQLTCSGSRCYE